MEEARPAWGERGAAAALLAGMIAAIVLLAGGVLAVGSALADRHRAAIAADAAALGAASVALGRLPGDPCSMAAEVARANGAALGECTAAGAVIEVTATVPTAWGAVSASARAGPADTPRSRD